jgi:hypothetical protein
MRIRSPFGSLSTHTRTIKGKTYLLISGDSAKPTLHDRDPLNPDY